MAVKIDQAMLHGGWLHSHEEDEPGRMVFKSSSQQLPPARGRTGYEFHPDGRLTRIGSAPTDRTTEAQGHWSVDPEGRITIRMPDQPEKVLEVIAQDKDRLVVKT
jgi:hypothetical protein